MTNTLKALLATAALGLSAPAFAGDQATHAPDNTETSNAVSGSMLYKTNNHQGHIETDGTVDMDAKVMMDTRPVMTTTTNTAVISGFDSYDANRDGRVDFSEYSMIERKTGMRDTQIAQRFVKMSKGQAYLDRGTYDTAAAFGTDYYDNSFISSTPNTAVLNTTTVNSVPTVTTDGLLMDDTVTSTSTTTDYKFNTTGTYSTGSVPSATTEPLYRPEDKVLGDLTRTPSVGTQTQDYPSSYDGTVDADSTIEFGADVELDVE